MLGLKPLELCRLEADLIWTYKILNNLVKLDADDFFKMWYTKSRTHSKKLYPAKCQNWINCRKNFFSLRVVNIWNALPEEIVNADSLPIFKKRLEEYDLSTCLKFNRHMPQF